MYNLIVSRSTSLLVWGSIEALFGGFVWQAYRTKNSRYVLCLYCFHYIITHICLTLVALQPSSPPT
ncbi:hypothetical protein BJ912DRAFT_941492 [Pholiota molesta]|nr:hypothetical protein BJ912DRAFT_941492 [Pholiota molesta]